MANLNDLRDLYTDVGRRLDTVLGTKEIMWFWTALKKVREEFDALRDSDQYDGFETYLRETYGVQLHFNNEGNIEQRVDIVDEQKYLFFRLKY
jgi:hypothetical protein